MRNSKENAQSTQDAITDCSSGTVADTSNSSPPTDESPLTTPENAASDDQLTNSPAPDTAPDPFDPENLRLSQDFATDIGVKKVLRLVPVRKPSNGIFVWVHPDEGYRIQTGVLELREEREIYLVQRELWQHLGTEATFSPRMLFTTISRQGVLTLWPVRLPGPDGRIDSWNRSALDAAKLAMTRWVRITANMALGGYDVYEATGELPEPEWPDITFGEILKIAFKDHFIDSFDHPVLRRLRGEI